MDGERGVVDGEWSFSADGRVSRGSEDSTMRFVLSGPEMFLLFLFDDECLVVWRRAGRFFASSGNKERE